MQKITIVEEKFYGRLKSRKLTDRQNDLFNTLFPKVSVEHFNDIDKTKYESIFLEIGFGGGEHIAEQAFNHSNNLYIGCEPFVNGVASLLCKIEDNDIRNIKIYQNDARNILKEIPENTLRGAYLLFPDPWPKRKHIRRRFLQIKTIETICNKLIKGGVWRIATDHPEYQVWLKKHINLKEVQSMFDIKIFESYNRPDINDWPKTRYEQKATNNIIYVELTKL